MFNHIVIVGKVNTIQKIEDKKNLLSFTLEVPRNYKNESGKYEIDFVPCQFSSMRSEDVNKYLKKNDTVGIKGRIETKMDYNKNISSFCIMVEKMTFLSKGVKE